MTTFIVILLVLALIGAPLFVIVGSATALCFYLLSTDLANTNQMLMIVQSMEQLLTRKEFLAIPLFMATGAIMTAGGMAARLVNIAKAGLGWLPGGMAVAAVTACMFFAAISGSSPVTLIAVGSIMFPAMIDSKYPENFSLGLITTAGSLGCLVPPSISILIYSIVVGADTVNPRDLFLAGLLPAIFIAGMLAAYSIFQGLKIPGARQRFSFTELRTATREGIWALMLPVLVLGGIYGGFYNPSEAGAVAAAYALIVTMFVYRDMPMRKLYETLVESSILMGSLLLIIVLAFGLNKYLASIQVEQKLMSWIQGMDMGPFTFLLLVNVILIVIGALMDSISCTLIFAPMLAPVAYKLYGIDPLHFGIVFVVNMEIGYIMPPVATNLFVASAVFKKPFGQVTRAVMPTLGLTMGALLIIMYVPTLSKALVNWKNGQAVYQSFPWGHEVPKVLPGAMVESEEGIVTAQEDPNKPKGGIDIGGITRETMAEEEGDGGAEDTPDAGGKGDGKYWDCEGELAGDEVTGTVCAQDRIQAKAAGKTSICKEDGGCAESLLCVPSDNEDNCERK